MAANALAGVGGVPANVIQTTSGGVITGTQSAATAGIGVSYQGIPANVPAVATALSLTTTQTLSTNARYSTMSLSGSGTLNISGNVTIYCVGNLSMANAAAINLLPGASLVLFVAGNVTMSNTATFNFNTGDPRRVRVYFTTGTRSLTMSNDSRFCGQAFNPGGGLTLSGSAFETPRYLGVFHGTTISTSSFTNIHADAAYGASSVSGSATTTILEWRQDR
jgi:hypothetical protein